MILYDSQSPGPATPCGQLEINHVYTMDISKHYKLRLDSLIINFQMREREVLRIQFTGSWRLGKSKVNTVGGQFGDPGESPKEAASQNSYLFGESPSLFLLRPSTGSSSHGSAGNKSDLASMRTQVQSLALLSELRVWCCQELWWRLQTGLGSDVAVAVAQASGIRYSSNLTPSLELSICQGYDPKKTEKKKKKKRRLTNWIRPTHDAETSLLYSKSN